MNDKETLIARLRGQCNHDEAHALLEEAADMLESLAQPAQEQDAFKSAYIEAMIASNEAGFAGMTAAETIRELSRMVSEQPVQPEQEPVAWMNDQDVGFKKSEFGATPTVPLYTAPPQRTWVDLSPAEIQAVAKQARSKDHAVTLTNKFLKEKNT